MTTASGVRAPRKTLLQALRNAVTNNKVPLRQRLVKWVGFALPVLMMPITVWFLSENRNIHKDYGMTWMKLFRLTWRMYRNTTRVFTGTSYRSHLAMLIKLLEIPPTTRGVVVECGCYLGGSTANLSLICKAVGRELIVYDSFEGLPANDANDRIATPLTTGFLKGPLEIVRANVERLGAIEVCQFRKGWFSDSLPAHAEPIALCFLDVDFQMSIHQCLVNLWPHLIDEGYLFTDDYTILDLCAVFFSEEFWRREFNRHPPGLVGAGTGVAMGQYWMGPFVRMGGNPAYPMQAPSSVGYTRKDFSGHWGYVPPVDDLQDNPAQ
jgi:O-methyltransferase